MRKVLLLFVVLTMGFVSSGCSDNTAEPSAGPSTSDSDETTVDVAEKDFGIAVTPGTASTRKVKFNITNAGPTTHEFVVFKTDLDLGALPLTSDGTAVNEEGAGVTHIDEKEDIAKGATTTLSVTLEPGKYAFVCNLPTHYKLGMRAGFTVSS